MSEEDQYLPYVCTGLPSCINCHTRRQIIAGSSKCTTNDLSCLLIKLPSTIKDGLVRYCNTKTSHFELALLIVLVLTPGSVLEKKLTGGLGLFFGSEIFDIPIFLGFGKISLIFLGLKIFHLFFSGSNFDAIYFFGCPVRRITQIARRTYFFGFVIFMNLFFWV